MGATGMTIYVRRCAAASLAVCVCHLFPRESVSEPQQIHVQGSDAPLNTLPRLEEQFLNRTAGRLCSQPLPTKP